MVSHVVTPLLWLLLSAGPVLADSAAPDEATAEVRSDELPMDATTLDDSGATIGEIVVNVGDVFDPELPGENRKLYRFINRLHRKTREHVIRRALLFQSGDPFSSRQIEESARNLRDTQYLYDAEVRPLRYEDGRVDVEVRTRDVWSLQAGVSFGRSGGENTTRFGLEDKNFLGLGQSLTFKHTSDVDRTSSLFRFLDPNLFGRRMNIEVNYSDNSDGQLRRLVVERPFFSLNSRWATGVTALSDERVDSLYSLGKITDSFGHDETSVEVWAGFSRGLANGRVGRRTVGLTLERNRFSRPVGDPDATFIPPDRQLTYPWIEFASIEDEYFIARDLDEIERQEDRNLGRQYKIRLGLISTALGSDRDRARLAASYTSGWSPGSGEYVFFDGSIDGRFGAGEPEDFQVAGGVRVYLRNFRRNVMFVELRADLTENLDAELQLLLGGDNGLRGYPLRYQNGDRRVLLTVEQRFFADWHVFKLVRVGAAAFVDVGRSWFKESPGDPIHGWLRDAGVGLRLGSSRTSAASMLHIDLAVPLDGDRSISNLQVLVKTKNSF